MRPIDPCASSAAPTTHFSPPSEPPNYSSSSSFPRPGKEHHADHSSHSGSHPVNSFASGHLSNSSEGSSDTSLTSEHHHHHHTIMPSAAADHSKPTTSPTEGRPEPTTAAAATTTPTVPAPLPNQAHSCTPHDSAATNTSLKRSASQRSHCQSSTWEPNARRGKGPVPLRLVARGLRHGGGSQSADSPTASVSVSSSSSSCSFSLPPQGRKPRAVHTRSSSVPPKASSVTSTPSRHHRHACSVQYRRSGASGNDSVYAATGVTPHRELWWDSMLCLHAHHRSALDGATTLVSRSHEFLCELAARERGLMEIRQEVKSRENEVAMMRGRWHESVMSLMAQDRSDEAEPTGVVEKNYDTRYPPPSKHDEPGSAAIAQEHAEQAQAPRRWKGWGGRLGGLFGTSPSTASERSSDESMKRDVPAATEEEKDKEKAAVKKSETETAEHGYSDSAVDTCADPHTRTVDGTDTTPSDHHHQQQQQQQQRQQHPGAEDRQNGKEAMSSPRDSSGPDPSQSTGSCPKSGTKSHDTSPTIMIPPSAASLPASSTASHDDIRNAFTDQTLGLDLWDTTPLNASAGAGAGAGAGAQDRRTERIFLKRFIAEEQRLNTRIQEEAEPPTASSAASS